MSDAEVLKTKPIQTEQVLTENEKAETTIVIEEPQSNNDDFDKNIDNHEANTKNRLDNDTVPSSVLEDVVETARIEEQSKELYHVGKSRKITHWIQYNRAYIQGQGQDQPNQPHQNFGGQGFGPYGGNYDSGPPMYYDPQSRNSFIKLVFAILLVMLSTTGGYLFLVMITPPLKNFYVTAGLPMIICSMIILTGMHYVMICSTCSRVPPCNFVALLLVVITMSNFVAAISVRYKSHILIFALVATTVTVAVCLLLACSSFDFTAWYIYFVAIVVVFSVVSVMISVAMLIMNIKYKPLQIAMLFISAIINVVFLIMELQMILGDRSIEMGENDYALGAYLLYNSIINLFLSIMQMTGLMDE